MIAGDFVTWPRDPCIIIAAAWWGIEWEPRTVPPLFMSSLSLALICYSLEAFLLSAPTTLVVLVPLMPFIICVAPPFIIPVTACELLNSIPPPAFSEPSSRRGTWWSLYLRSAMWLVESFFEFTLLLNAGFKIPPPPLTACWRGWEDWGGVD